MAGCPVTLAYLKGLQSVYDFTLLHNSMFEESLHDLVLRAKLAGDSRQRLHQRGFLCVELMAHVLPLEHAHDLMFKLQTPDSRWPRSREGLNQLLAYSGADVSTMAAMLLEYEITDGKRRKGIHAMHKDLLQSMVTTLEQMRGAAVVLRQALKNPHVRLSRIGRRLVRVVREAGYTLPRALSVADYLLEQDETDAERAWTLTQA